LIKKLKFDYFLNNKLKSFLHKLLKKITYGNLNVQYPDGYKYQYKGLNKGISVEITLNNYKLIKNILLKGNIGFGESYINKDFNTSNLTNLIELIIQNKKSFQNISNGNILYRFFQQYIHYQNNNSIKNSVNNISFHYDLGNEFYKQWLDDTMSYSSALYDEKMQDLKIAQLNKYERLLKILKPSENSKILEIGCGWGSLATYFAKNTNAHITAVTISKEQFEHVSNNIFNEGLNENIKVELKDYRNINKQFDSIISVEMFEAVGQKYWSLFFNKLKNNLKLHGKAALQVITIDDDLFENYKKRPDFIQKYIFPGGMLPSKKIFRNLIYNEGLLIDDEYDFAHSYAKTLNEWNKRFQNSWPEISKQGFNSYFKRMWEYYFSYCEGGFKAKSIDISQFLLIK
tara:strand:+ start:4859 stop:6061 length:1203 start_codon:yes stop_codon:yes gene_type:complete